MEREILDYFSNKGYSKIKTTKQFDKRTKKGNYILEKDNKKYLTKVFTGPKKYNLFAENLYRERLNELNFSNVEKSHFEEKGKAGFLFIPYIENKGNLSGKEEKYSGGMISLVSDFHNLTEDFFKGNKGKTLRKVADSFSKINLYNDYLKVGDFKNVREFLRNSNNNLDLEKLVNDIEIDLRKHSAEGKQVFSHNDFNGDNIILTKSGSLALGDFEKCSIGFEIEDFSKAYFHFCWENNKKPCDDLFYQNILEEKNFSKKLFDDYLLYRSLLVYEYINRENSSTQGKLKEKIYEYKKSAENIIEKLIE